MLYLPFQVQKKRCDFFLDLSRLENPQVPTVEGKSPQRLVRFTRFERLVEPLRRFGNVWCVKGACSRSCGRGHDSAATADSPPTTHSRILEQIRQRLLLVLASVLFGVRDSA